MINNTKETMYMNQNLFIHVVFLCIFNVIFMLGGICFNIVVILSLWRCQLRKKLCYFTVLLLSCFDFAVVAITHPLIISYSVASFLEVYGKPHHEIVIFGCMLLHGYSMFGLLMLNVERFLALNYPFCHQKYLTNKRLALFLAIICFSYTIVLAAFRSLAIPNIILVVTSLSIFMFLFVYLNYKIFIIAKAKKQHNANITNSSTQKETLNWRRLSIFKKISTCYLTVLCYFTCSAPTVVYCAVCEVKPDEMACKEDYPTQWILTLISMNSTFNCLIFFWRNSILRKEGMKMAKQCLRRSFGYGTAVKNGNKC